MLRFDHNSQLRHNHKVDIDTDFVIVGGGMAGVCSAISAARAGVKVCLIQDRPVLGGCGSSEVRVWILGATSHLGNNNRWSREGGVIDELLIENLFRNKEGNATIFDTILLDKVSAEPNITLLLNTAVFAAEKSTGQHISSVRAFCSQNSTEYVVTGKMFCDSSGDGILGFLTGAPFVIGAESQAEFGEKLAPKQEQSELLGHTLFFYSKDAGKAVDFTLPEFAKNTEISNERLSRVTKGDDGIRLWWIEYGGTTDTIHETESIKWELWSVVYTIWDHIKNSGKFDDVDNLTLEWVGTIPGKRESRRFIGQHMLTQQDIVNQHTFDDAISFGGWAIDHHPSEGVYSDESPCQQFHSKGIYQIPLSCFVSKGMDNLFLAGRIISTSHIAFGSSRVMATSAHGGQAVGAAAAMCILNGIQPEQLFDKRNITQLQHNLNETGHFIPHVPMVSNRNLASTACITATSELALSSISFSGEYRSLTTSSAQVLPLEANTHYQVKVPVKVTQTTDLIVQLRVSDKAENYTPNEILEEQVFNLQPGEQSLKIEFNKAPVHDQYCFVCFLQNEDVAVGFSNERITGIVSAFNGTNKAVSNNGKQTVNANMGIDEFEFWCPARRPNGQNIALDVSPSLALNTKDNIYNGYTRPWFSSNAWVADLNDKQPELTFKWTEKQLISQIILHFDNDFDHPLESTLWGHPEKRIPFCVSEYKILDETGKVVCEVNNNHQTVNNIKFEIPISTSQLTVQLANDNQNCPVSLFEIIIR
ncbi:MAG: FAD-dependent oxidoreductase [Shewanella sp.]|nr:FAD-dependent oxidoreductase [Shewanella sp.]